MDDTQLHTMNEINVKVRWTIYENERDGFFITCCKMDDYPDNIIALFNAVSVEKEDTFTLTGEWKHTDKYGWQFKADVAVPNNASNTEGLKKFLMEHIKGIGKKKAKLLVDTFGKDTEAVFNTQPEKIKECLNVSDKVFMNIMRSWEESNHTNKYILELSKIGITGKTAINVYRTYGDKCIENIRKNPYQLIDDVKRIGFKKADNIAKEMGIQQNDARRIDAGIIYVITTLTEFGNTCSEKDKLIKETAKTLEVDEELVEKELDLIISEEKLINEDGYIYLKKLYYEENLVADTLKKLSQKEINYIHIADEIASETGINYTEEQKAAIDMSVSSSIMVLTGGPGTGKTTTVKGIIKANEKAGKTVICAAPTGRASKRMQEATEHEAKTIHRLLEFSGEPDGEDMKSILRFNRNEDNPLECDAIIIDEASMVDSFLFLALLKAVAEGTRLVLVGDTDQLHQRICEVLLNDQLKEKMVHNAVKTIEPFTYENLADTHRRIFRDVINR